MYKSQPRNQISNGLFGAQEFSASENSTLRHDPKLMQRMPLRRAAENGEMGKENLPSGPWHLHREVSFRKEHTWKLRTWKLTPSRRGRP